jgi:large subunit ribosomal protein L30
MTEQATIKIQLWSSPIGSADKLRRIVKGLGLRKINQVVIKPDTPGFRGMVTKIPHLLRLVTE